MTEIEAKNLTTEEKNIIAEYIYSYQTEILIKSDAERVIELFKNRGFDTSKVELEAHSVMNLIRLYIDSPDRDDIMNLYFQGKL